MVLIRTQVELQRVLWPIFTYSYFDLIANDATSEAQRFFHEFSSRLEQTHAEELRTFQTITLKPHLFDNPIAKLYRENKYRLPLSSTAYYNLITFLEQRGKQGGAVIVYLLQTYCEVRTSERGQIQQFSFEAIINQAKNLHVNESIEFEEGIQGAFTGVSNKDVMDNSAIVRLGMMPMEPELAIDVRAELEDEDMKNPPGLGKSSLVEVFDQNIKREDSADAPTRNEIPLPPSRARDVMMEVQKIKENRDRFKIDARTGGIGPGVSVCMFTFHNTLDR